MYIVAPLFPALLYVIVTLSAGGQALPTWIPVADGASASNVLEESWGEVAMPKAGPGAPTVERGRHWSFTLRVGNVADDAPSAAVVARLRGSWTTAGWTMVQELKATPPVVVWSRVAGGKTAHAVMTVFDPSDVRVDVVEVGPQPLTFTVPAPGEQPEALASLEGPIPFLPPLPGSRLLGGGWNDEVLKFKVQESDELQVVGTGYLGRHYQGPAPGLSNVQFFTVYREALIKAGWRIVEARQQVNAGDTTLVAHYTARGRDLWAYLHADGGEYSIDVADAGQDDLAKQLRDACRAPLYGVLFDFNKATIKSESEAVLARAAAALTAAGAKAFEVQGHTDNVGTDAYNQTLSEARARSVMQWFVSKGIAATRLTAKGYGKGQPVADNDTDAGRARNRRVELACAAS
jgi:outer membrane protein OmpA-like peptidoglycan-associated protein